MAKFNHINVKYPEAINRPLYSGDRGVWMGGYYGAPGPGRVNLMDYITISTIGNATDFGDLTKKNMENKGCSNGGLNTGTTMGGNDQAGYTNRIEKITISSTGNATDFGGLTLKITRGASVSNHMYSRYLYAGGRGWGGVTSQIQVGSIKYGGNALNGGDLLGWRSYLQGTSNGMLNRAVFADGGPNELTWPNYNCNIIEYINIQSLGDSLDFGDLTAVYPKSPSGGGHDSRKRFSSTSNLHWNRGIFTAGYNSDVIDYVTISTTGNATDFGNMSARCEECSATSNGGNQRGVTCLSRGGGTGFVDTLDYITISSLGNSTDFGDLTMPRAATTAVSNS